MEHAFLDHSGRKISGSKGTSEKVALFSERNAPNGNLFSISFKWLTRVSGFLAVFW